MARSVILRMLHKRMFLVMARTDPSSTGSNGISAFLVDATLDGIRVGDPPKMLGNEGFHACYVWFENCEVPADSIVGGQEGRGLKAA